MYNNEVIKEKSWFKRNWKWVVPTGGCLTLIIVAIVLIVSAVYSISSSLDNSDYAQYVMEKVNQNDKAIELLGQPIEKGNVSDFNFQWVNGESKISFKMKVSGSKNKGVIYVKATKEDNSYTYNEAMLRIDETDEEINILSN